MAFFRRYLIIAAAFCCAGHICAQQSASGALATAYQVTLLGLPHPQADYSGLVLLVGDQTLPVDVPPGARGRPLKLVKGAKELTISRQGVDPQTGKSVYKPLATAAWPGEKCRETLLIVGPGSSGGDFKAMALDDSLSAFPAESIRVLNLTGIPLQAKINDFSGELKHAQISQIIAYPDMKKLPPQSVARYPMALAAKSAEGKMLRLYSGYMEAPPITRSFILIQPPLEAGSKKIRVKTITDQPPIPSSGVAK